MSKASDVHLPQAEGSHNSMFGPEIDGIARFAVDEHNRKQNEDAVGLIFRKVTKVNFERKVPGGKFYCVNVEVSDGKHQLEYEVRVLRSKDRQLKEFKLLHLV